MNTGENRCPGCHGMGAVAAEMGCFGPRRMEQCGACHGTGDSPPCWICKTLKTEVVPLAKVMYGSVPLCKDHNEKRCEHNRVRLLGCPACMLAQQKALTRVEVLEEAAKVCSDAGNEKNAAQEGRDYDPFSAGAASGCFQAAVKLGELVKVARAELAKFEE